MGSMESPHNKTDDYLLSRDLAARIRLNHQHFMNVKHFGHVLHPAIPRKEGMKIADVGTGSGIWMVDLAPTLPPNSTLHGFDLSLRQTPHKAWLPANITFSKLDIFGDLPPELEGQFDVVGVRMFLVVVRDDDPSIVLRNLYKMLKPGGYLEWFDMEFSHLSSTESMVFTEPHLKGDSMREMHQLIVRSDPRFDATWVLQLDKFVEKAGFTQVQTKIKRPTDPDILPWLTFSNDQCVNVFMELMAIFPRGSKERARMEELYPKAVQEAWSGVAYNPPRINVIARKPE